MTNSFGMDVKIALMKRDITMTEFAKTLGISLAYLSDILSGKREAVEQKKRIAKLLNIQIKSESVNNYRFKGGN